MLPLAVVLSDLGDLLPQPLRHPSMWLANQRDDTLRAGIANRAPAGNLNTLVGGRNFHVRQHERRWIGASHGHVDPLPDHIEFGCDGLFLTLGHDLSECAAP